MCQDNIKIREEGELENESVQNVLKQPLIIRKVLESLDFPSLLQCRIVSKSWEKEATFILAKRCQVTFKDIDSLKEFTNLLYPEKKGTDSIGVIESFLFTHVSFQFDVESEAKKKTNEEIVPLQTFLRLHAKQVTSIETPTVSFKGAHSVADWAEKMLNELSPSVTDKSEVVEKNEVVSEVQEETESAPVVPMDNNNNEIKQENEVKGKEDNDDQPATIILAQNGTSEIAEIEVNTQNQTNAKLDDESNLQEIVIHDNEDEIIEKSPPEVKSSMASVNSTTQRKPMKSVHFSIVENPDYVPIPYCDEGYSSFSDFYPYYLGEHSHLTGRRLHFLGITNSIILIIIGTFTLTPVLYAVALIQAYLLAVGAHLYFERHIPRPVFRNPIYMAMGNLKMWWEVASGQRAI